VTHVLVATALYGAGAVAATVGDGQFRVSLESGEQHTAWRLLLATGVIDNLRDVPGLQERWGHGVYQCPYCDG
jgi:thioredoxin reductase